MNDIAKWWIFIIVLLLIFFGLSIAYTNKNNKFHSLLIIDRPVEMEESKQLDLNKYEDNLNDYLGNSTEFTILTWLFIAPVNRDNLISKNILPLTNILCKGRVDQPLPLILFNHYTNSIYIYMSISGNTTNLLNQISQYGNRFWVDLESHPEKYPNIYILPNILVGRWFQLGLIINGQILEIYKNSKLSQSIILQNSLITDKYQTMIHVGPIEDNEYGVNIEGLKGEIAQLRFFPRILSIKEINDIYEIGLNQNIASTWAVKSSEWMNDTANKYIDPIPEKLMNIGSNIGSWAKDKTLSLGKNIKGKTVSLGKNIGLNIGSNPQSSESLQKNQLLLSNICNKKDYMPNPLPSREVIGDELRQCNSDCDCYGVDKCNMKTYACDTEMQTELVKPMPVDDLTCVVSDNFKNNNSQSEINQQNRICNSHTYNTCPDDNCYTSGDCGGPILSSYKNIDSENLKKLNVRPVNSYICDKLCYDEKDCDSAVYLKSLESCFSNNGKQYCTMDGSDITINKLSGKTIP